MLARLVEQRTLKKFSVKLLADDLTHHIYPIALNQAKIAVVSEKPLVFLRQCRKTWLEFDRKLARQRSSTVSMQQIKTLEAILSIIRSTHFSTKPPQRLQNSGVFFLQPSQLKEVGNFNIVYLIDYIGLEDYNFGKSAVVVYKFLEL